MPTCPAWATDGLVAHLAMVHRWAAAHVRGDDPASVPNQTEIRTTVDDLLGYYRDWPHRAARGVSRCATRPRGIDVPQRRAGTARLLGPPSGPRDDHPHGRRPRRLARPAPDADEANIETSLAADGIDELLRGFFTRGRSKLFDGTEYTIAVIPNDVEQRWVVSVAERLTVAPDGAAVDADADVRRHGGTALPRAVEPRRRSRHGGPSRRAREVASRPARQLVARRPAVTARREMR